MVRVGERLSDILGETTATAFEEICSLILTDASSRQYKPSQESTVRVRPEDRLRLAVADLLTACGLLSRRDVRGIACFTITDLGRSAAERLNRRFMDRLHARR